MKSFLIMNNLLNIKKLYCTNCLFVYSQNKNHSYIIAANLKLIKIKLNYNHSNKSFYYTRNKSIKMYNF